MKRFEYDEAETCYVCHGLVENEQGRFVRYEEVEDLIATIQEEKLRLRELVERGSHFPWGIGFATDRFVQDCREEMGKWK